MRPTGRGVAGGALYPRAPKAARGGRDYHLVACVRRGKRLQHRMSRRNGADLNLWGSTLTPAALCPRSRISTACSWTSGFYARLRLFPWPELNRHLYGHLPVPPL